MTGGQDHVVKVLQVETGLGLFTFHGHYGPITAMFIDASSPDYACTSSQDGMLCMWDLSNGNITDKHIERSVLRKLLNTFYVRFLHVRRPSP